MSSGATAPRTDPPGTHTDPLTGRTRARCGGTVPVTLPGTRFFKAALFARMLQKLPPEAHSVLCAAAPTA